MKALLLAHNHPLLHAGGTEIFARRLARGLDEAADVSACFAAMSMKSYGPPNPGTFLRQLDGAGGDFLFAGGAFDRFLMSQHDTYGFLDEFERFLAELAPDVVHFHHFIGFGVESLFAVKHVLPRAAIVVTLHDYYLQCHNEGLLTKTESGQICKMPAPTACHLCFPKIPIEQFRLRELYISRALSVVDRFVAPSRYLLKRYVEWGLDPARIVHIPNGHPQKVGAVRRSERRERSVRFGFFGNLQEHKGVLVLMRAADLLALRGIPFELHLHGSDRFSSESVRAAVREGEARLGRHIVRHGSYDPEQATDLMQGVDWVVFPSIWPENSPLVIQEAFMAGKPVICADAGGMAEHVPDRSAGLLFRMGDASELADTMEEAVSICLQEKWEGLELPAVNSIEDCTRQHLQLYRELQSISAPEPTVPGRSPGLERPAKAKRRLKRAPTKKAGRAANVNAVPM